MSEMNKNRSNKTDPNIIKHGYQPAGDGGIIQGGYIPQDTDNSGNTIPEPPSGGSSQQDD